MFKSKTLGLFLLGGIVVDEVANFAPNIAVPGMVHTVARWTTPIAGVLLSLRALNRN